MSDAVDHSGHRIQKIYAFKENIEKNPKLLNIINFENQMEVKLKTLLEFIISKLNSFV